MYLSYTILKFKKNKDYNGFFKFPLIVFAIILLLELYLSKFGDFPCKECGGDPSDFGVVFFLTIPIYIILNIEYIIFYIFYRIRCNKNNIKKANLIYLISFLIGVPLILFLIMIFM